VGLSATLGANPWRDRHETWGA